MVVLNRNILKLNVIALLCYLIFFTSNTQAASSGSKSNHPIYIQADKMQAHPKKQYIEFQGNVKVRQDDIELSSDTLQVVMKSSKTAVSMTEESVKQITAKGHVIIHWKEYRVESGVAVYDPPGNKLVLTGEKTRLVQGKNIIAGSQITVNLETEQIQIDSKKGEQVQAVYEFSNPDVKH